MVQQENHILPVFSSPRWIVQCILHHRQHPDLSCLGLGQVPRPVTTVAGTEKIIILSHDCGGHWERWQEWDCFAARRIKHFSGADWHQPCGSCGD